MFLEHQIISERSCDTEDWSNDASITEINYILQYIHTENSYFKCYNISQFQVFTLLGYKKNAALVSRRDFFQKHKKIIIIPNF